MTEAPPNPASTRLPAPAPAFSKWLALSILALSLLTAIGVRVRLLDFPLERDEGEYAYAGHLILEGIPPYRLVYNQKMPGIYLAYAAVMAVFGQATAGIRLGLLAAHLATVAALFLLARKWLDLAGAAIAAAAYALMTLSPAFLGLAAHATHFVVLPALLGILLLLRDREAGGGFSCLCAGILFGVGFLMKQQGMFFGFFGGLWLAWDGWQGRAAWRPWLARLVFFALGCPLPFLSVCLWLKIAGVFPAFWFWTITYAREYVGVVALSAGLISARSALADILHAAPLLWLLALLGLAILCGPRVAWRARIFIGGLLLFAAAAVCPGYYFREHYFIVLVPAVSLLIGLAVTAAGQWLAEKRFGVQMSALPLGVAALACAQSLYADRAVYFTLSPDDACREVYTGNPFPESPAIAQYLEEHTQKDDRIAIIGSEPQILFHARRHSSTGYIYTLPLLQPQPYARAMQEAMINEIETNPPAYYVFVSAATSWGFQRDSSYRLSDWAFDRANEGLELEGLIQHDRQDMPVFAWGPDAATAPLISENYVAIFKRSAAARPNDAARARNQRLRDLFYQAQSEEVIKQYRDALRKNPDNAEARNNLGVILTKSGRNDEAITELQEALRTKPNFLAAQYNLGNAFLNAGKFADAAAHFQSAITLAPTNAAAHYNLGVAINRLGRASEAIAEFQTAIRLQTNYPIARNNLGIALASQGRLDDAIAQFQEAAREDPSYANARMNLKKALALKSNTTGTNLENLKR